MNRLRQRRRRPHRWIVRHPPPSRGTVVVIATLHAQLTELATQDAPALHPFPTSGELAVGAGEIAGRRERVEQLRAQLFALGGLGVDVDPAFDTLYDLLRGLAVRCMASDELREFLAVVGQLEQDQPAVPCWPPSAVNNGRRECGRCDERQVWIFDPANTATSGGWVKLP